MIKDLLHQNYCSRLPRLREWYKATTEKLSFPVYSSYDIRDSGYKVSNVDANIYPAGFNNICHQDMDAAVEIMDHYLKSHYGAEVQRVLLVTEEHTQNPYYWDNVAAIRDLIERSGRKIFVGMPSAIQPMDLKSASGKTVHVEAGRPQNQALMNFKPQVIISNNDFSNPHKDWAEAWQSLALPINPPRELGWYQRKKSTYFKHYNQLVLEFSNILDLDPFALNVMTDLHSSFDLDDEKSMAELAAKVDAMISKTAAEYKKRDIDAKPVVFVKSNAGTYGMGVVRVESGAELLNWNSKARKKMKASKGGNQVTEVIVQEGIPSRVESDGAVAEPVIYMIGCELAGGFLRTHSDKSATDSLNAPGAVYKRLCVSDLNVGLDNSPLENVYGWSAKLGLIAIGLEAQEMGIPFVNYVKTSCSSHS